MARMTDKENFYDQKISPLMEQVIVRCHEGKIRFLIVYELDRQENGDVMLCTSASVGTETDARLHQMLEMLNAATHGQLYSNAAGMWQAPGDDEQTPIA